MVEMPLLDLEKCNGCGLCADVCGCHAMVLANGIITVITTEDCGWCGQCEAVCPTGAIACSFEIVVEEH